MVWHKFYELLVFLAKLLPESNEILVYVNEGKKTMSALGLKYVKIHGCPNGCMLYRKEYERLFEGHNYGLSRLKKYSSAD